MTAPEVLKELKSFSDDGTRRILINHGAPESCIGVKIGDMQPLRKKIKKDYQLALDLYDTGIYDAMYFATLIADETKMTKTDLNRWAKEASPPLAGSAVPGVAAETPFGWEQALKWIDSKKDLVAGCGWATLSGLVSIREDSELDIAKLKALIARVKKEISASGEEVKYQMNGFLISVGCYVAELTDLAKKTGKAIGTVEVDMGNTACKVPYSPDYIAKVEKRGTIGKKRKTARC